MHIRTTEFYFEVISLKHFVKLTAAVICIGFLLGQITASSAGGGGFTNEMYVIGMFTNGGNLSNATSIAGGGVIQNECFTNNGGSGTGTFTCNLAVSSISDVIVVLTTDYSPCSSTISDSQGNTPILHVSQTTAATTQTYAYTIAPSAVTTDTINYVLSGTCANIAWAIAYDISGVTTIGLSASSGYSTSNVANESVSSFSPSTNSFVIGIGNNLGGTITYPAGFIPDTNAPYSPIIYDASWSGGSTTMTITYVGGGSVYNYVALALPYNAPVVSNYALYSSFIYGNNMLSGNGYSFINQYPELFFNYPPTSTSTTTATTTTTTTAIVTLTSTVTSTSTITSTSTVTSTSTITHNVTVTSTATVTSTSTITHNVTVTSTTTLTSTSTVTNTTTTTSTIQAVDSGSLFFYAVLAVVMFLTVYSASVRFLDKKGKADND
jgi:hypothetical protein